MQAPRVLVESRSKIGESPVWDARKQCLYWVDVEGGSIHCWNAADESTHAWNIGEPVGCIGLRDGAGLVGARRTGFFLLDAASGRITPLLDPESELPENRFNDGKVDRRGRFWAGTRNFIDTTKRTGALYRLDPDLSAHREEDGLGCPNGMAWSPDDRTMYLCDTWAGNIFAYDFDADDGVATNRRLFVAVPKADGFPDGLTVDAQGGIWNAHYNGWRITRYTPGGRIDRTIPLPVRNVTSVTFGGAGHASLFITSSHLRLTDAERAAQPLAGHVFVCDPGVGGIPEPRFAG